LDLLYQRSGLGSRVPPNQKNSILQTLANAPVPYGTYLWRRSSYGFRLLYIWITGRLPSGLHFRTDEPVEIEGDSSTAADMVVVPKRLLFHTTHHWTDLDVRRSCAYNVGGDDASRVAL